MLYEYTLVAEQGLKYTDLGYKTLEGDIPFVKLSDHRIIQGFIIQYTPKPKKPALAQTMGRKSQNGKRY